VSQTTSTARRSDTLSYGSGSAAMYSLSRRRARNARALASRSVPVVGLLALVVFFSITAGDRFMTTGNWLTLVQQAAVVAIIGFGLSFVIIAGSIDLSVGAVAGLAGMVMAGVGTEHGALIGILAGLATGAACGLINGALLALLRVPSFIATLGALSMASGLTLVYSHSESKPVPASVLRAGVEPGIYVVLGVAFLASAALFNLTTLGRYTRAVGGDERVAALAGVPVRRVKIAIFVFGGLMAALAGIVLSARLGVADPQAGTGFELTAISAVVVGGTPLTGGIGNIWNTVIGALLIQVLANGLVILGVTPEVQQIVQGAIIIVAVLVALDRRKIGVIK
jgi:ribose/xylose/arabinose/galactoside ABC-type transport system permease subunit